MQTDGESTASGGVPPSAEQGLAEWRERYRAIVDTAVDGIITIGEDGLIQSFNRAAERIFGWTESEVVGRNVNMLMPEPDRSAHDRYIQNYLRSGQAKVIGIGRETVGLRKDGSRFPHELTIGEAHLGDRRLFTGFVRDISERKNAEAEARRRLQELAQISRVASMGELATVLAHEVNQPLTAIITHATACLRLLRSGGVDAQLLEASLTQIARQGERAGEVIRRLRQMVRDGNHPAIKPADLNALVRDMLWLLQHEIDARRVSVALQLAPALPAVEMDAVQIEQVLFNLVQNALEALSERDGGRELRVITRPCREDGREGVLCMVEDNGPGFGQRDPQELFTPYVTTKASGLGQGLAICRTLVEAHHGRLRAEAAEPQGARFWFVLPCAQPRA